MLAKKPEWMKPLGKHLCKCEDTIKETECEVVDWIYLAQGRVH
jgi:hypothetical protein